MRALCGAIITCGALIGLGLTALAIGTRYHTTLGNVDSKGEVEPLHLYQMDKPLLFVLVFLSVVAVIGLGIAFLGLAYHHRRRSLEHELQRERLAGTHRSK
jgi:hypothetical protein